MSSYFVIVTVLNTGILWFSWCSTIWWPIFIKFRKKGWTFTWNPTKLFQALYLLCNYNVKEYFSLLLFLLFSWNWVTRKPHIISRHADFFYAAHIIFLYCDNYGWKTWNFISFWFLFLSIVWSKDNTSRDYFDKITAWSS